MNPKFTRFSIAMLMMVIGIAIVYSSKIGAERASSVFTVAAIFASVLFLVIDRWLPENGY